MAALFFFYSSCFFILMLGLGTGDIVWFGQTAGLLHNLVAKRQWLLNVFGLLFRLQPCHSNDATLPIPTMLVGLLSHSDFGALFPSESGFNGKLREQIVELFRACHLSFPYRLDLAAQRGLESEAESAKPGTEPEDDWAALFQHALNSKGKARRSTRPRPADGSADEASPADGPHKPPAVSANKALGLIMRKAFTIEVFPSLLPCDPYNGFLGALPDMEGFTFSHQMSLRIDVDNCPAQKVQRVFWRTMSHVSSVALSAPRAASSSITVKMCRVCRDDLVLELHHNRYRKCRCVMRAPDVAPIASPLTHAPTKSTFCLHITHSRFACTSAMQAEAYSYHGLWSPHEVTAFYRKVMAASGRVRCQGTYA